MGTFLFILGFLFELVKFLIIVAGLGFIIFIIIGILGIIYEAITGKKGDNTYQDLKHLEEENRIREQEQEDEAYENTRRSYGYMADVIGMKRKEKFATCWRCGTSIKAGEDLCRYCSMVENSE